MLLVISTFLACMLKYILFVHVDVHAHSHLSRSISVLVYYRSIHDAVKSYIGNELTKKRKSADERAYVRAIICARSSHVITLPVTGRRRSCRQYANRMCMSGVLCERVCASW